MENNTQASTNLIQPKQEKQAVSLEEFIAKLDKSGRKALLFEGVLEQSFKQLSLRMQDLMTLKNEVEKKKTKIEQQGKDIQKKALQLITSSSITIDEAELKKSEKSISAYLSLLDNILGEIDRELSYFVQFFSDPAPKVIVALKNEPNTANEFLVYKTKGLGKYIRSIRKDLRVSFSRYTYIFNEQMQKLAYAEHMVALIKKNKATSL